MTSYPFQVTSESREPEYFRNILDAQLYAGEQSERANEKCFIYDLGWCDDVPVDLWRNGRAIRT
jgi:hypothetical protein